MSEDVRAVPRSWTGWVERLLRRPRRRMWTRLWLEPVLLVATLGAAVVNAVLLPVLYGVLVPVALLLAVASAAAIPLSLRMPAQSAALTVVCVGVTALLGRDADGLPWPVPVVTMIVFALVVMGLALARPWPVASLTAVLGLVVAALVALAISQFDHLRLPVENLITTACLLVVVLAFAILLRQWMISRDRVAEQEQRAEREAGLRRVAEERGRIARELHDVVAHSMSIISIQASTARYRLADVPEPVATELDQISESAREALVEMRSLLHVLRAEDAQAELAPLPMLPRLPELIEQTQRGGQQVEAEITGDLDADLPETSSLSAFRIVQEALSNAVRHAPGRPVTVRVAVGERTITVDVRNPAPPPSPVPVEGRLTERASERTAARDEDHPDAPGAGGGLGLLGMRERAAAAGGTVTAERVGGQFVVHAELPVRRPLSA